MVDAPKMFDLLVGGALQDGGFAAQPTSEVSNSSINSFLDSLSFQFHPQISSCDAGYIHISIVYTQLYSYTGQPMRSTTSPASFYV
jgi:hypothetical protein